MIHINNGGDGYKAGCGATWVDVSYLWDDVDCPACLKLRPTKPAPDAGDSAASSELVQASALSTSQTLSSPQRG
jgi:hypothetical protein